MKWRSKKDRVPQPAMVAIARDPERHSFWPGAALVLAALFLLACGATNETKLETSAGGLASELQLVRAFAHGGLELAPPPSAPDMASFEDPSEAVAALERFAQAEAGRPRLKYVVHAGAVDPCPT